MTINHGHFANQIANHGHFVNHTFSNNNFPYENCKFVYTQWSFIFIG